MADLDLGKQVGPLPLGAWFVVVAGGLGIALYSRNNAVDDSPFVVDDTSTTPGVGTGEVGGFISTQPTNDIPPVAITDNDTYGKAAINYLIAQGYNPAWAYSAITKALAGGQGDNKLSVREYALWSSALVRLGSPPFPVNIPPPTSIPGPVKNPGDTKHRYQNNPKKPGRCKICGRGRYNGIHKLDTGVPFPGTFRYAIVTPRGLPGSTLKSLSQIYYKTTTRWHDIYDANRAGKRRNDGTPGLIEDPNRLHPGWRLIIPR